MGKDVWPNGWGKVQHVCEHGLVGPKVVYNAVQAGRLRAARVGGRRALRFRKEWVDTWLESTAEPVEIGRGK